jgi:hypothetical protein
MMKSLALAAVAAICLSGWAGTASAEDVSNGMLAKMGLGGMKKMSDRSGMRVRGQGFAGVGGVGFSSVIVATDLDGYTGISGPVANALATGSSQTIAQFGLQLDATAFGLNAGTLSATIFAGTAGSSFAFAR